MSWFHYFPLWLFVADWALRLALALHIISRRRSVATSLAWLGLLVFVPVVGLVWYAMVGEAWLGSRRVRRYERVTKILDKRASKVWEERQQTLATVPGEYGHVARFGVAVSGLPVLRNNRLSLLADNASMLAALKADIDAAHDHVHLLYYIWSDDAGGRAIADALEKAVVRGVKVRVLVDGAGSRRFLRSDLCARMRAAGVKVVEALPVSPLRRPLVRVDLRNHRKIAVFDGRIGYCGSQNINDSTFRSSRWRKTGPWIDASVRIEGPAAQALGVTFLRDWELDAEEGLIDPLPFMPSPWPAGTEPAGESLVQVLPSGPGPTPKAIHQALLTAIYAAREELVMTTPYFVPDEAMLEALRSAAIRGVKVDIIMPSVSDSPLVAAAARAHYSDLLESGCSLHHYQGGLLHAKVLTVDRRVGLIGSTNMDNRSFFLNFEITTLVYDDDFASVLRFMQMEYLGRSVPVKPEHWAKRSGWQTLRDNAASLLGPLL